MLVGSVYLTMPRILILILFPFLLHQRLYFLNVQVVLVQILVPLFSVLGLLVGEFAELFLVYFLFEICESQVKRFMLV